MLATTFLMAFAVIQTGVEDRSQPARMIFTKPKIELIMSPFFREELELSEKQITAIENESKNWKKEYYKLIKETSPQRADSNEEKIRKSWARRDARTALESKTNERLSEVVVPAQWKRLNQLMAWRTIALRSEQMNWFSDPIISDRINPTEREKSAFQGIIKKSNLQRKLKENRRQAVKEMLETLTAEQRQKILELVDLGSAKGE